MLLCLDDVILGDILQGLIGIVDNGFELIGAYVLALFEDGCEEVLEDRTLPALVSLLGEEHDIHQQHEDLEVADVLEAEIQLFGVVEEGCSQYVLEVEEDLVGDGPEVPHHGRVQFLLTLQELQQHIQPFTLILLEDLDEEPRVPSEHLLGQIGVPT